MTDWRCSAGILVVCTVLSGCPEPPPATKASASSTATTAAAPPSASASASAGDRPDFERKRSGGPKARPGAAQITGDILHEPVHRAIRESLPSLVGCYADGIKKNAQLKGKVIFSFTIESSGAAKEVKPDADMKDKSVIDCATRVVSGLSFPKPKAGVVSVRYPILFSPGDDVAGKPAKDATQADVEKALADAGATGVTAKPKDGAQGAVVITGKNGAADFTIVFVPQAGAKLDPAEIDKLAAKGVVYTDDTLLVAVESSSPQEAEKVLKAIVKER
jgi:hypothetical protein